MATDNGSTTSPRYKAPITVTKLAEYRILEKLGQGTFGVVQKAVRSRGDNCPLVALKQLLVHSTKEGFPITALREITILKQLRHQNVLPISEIVYQEPVVSNPQEIVNTRGCFYTASPYMTSDLVGLLENPKISLELPHVKCLLRQLLTGVAYIHSQHFLHRDIKAANILVGHDGILKIADFGLARKYHGPAPQLLTEPNGSGAPGGGIRPYTGLVVTRWYRPPEILLGDRNYTTAVDVWGVGCVFAELFTRKPILPGKLDLQQAHLVFELLGLPGSWPAASKLPHTQEYLVGLACSRTMEQRFLSIMPPSALDLLSKLLELDPLARLNAGDALLHEFFTTDPLPVLPHDLPCFEDSHEIDKERFQSMRERSKRGDAVSNGSVPPPPPQSLSQKSTPVGPAKSRSIPTGPAAIHPNHRAILEPPVRLPQKLRRNSQAQSESVRLGKRRTPPLSPDKGSRSKRRNQSRF